MEKSIKVILKIHRKNLEDMLVKKTLIENDETKLHFYRDEMKKNFELEKQIALQNPYLLDYFYSYSSLIRERNLNIEISLKDLQKQKERLQNNIFKAYQDIKTYEIILKKQHIKKDKALKDEENKFLDEMSVLNYNFKQNN